MIERRRIPRSSRRAGAAAVVLVSLLGIVLVVAIAAGSIVVRQLATAAAESRSLFGVEQRLDDVTRLQLDEETELRGYLIAKDRRFLEPHLAGGADPFEDQVLALRGWLQRADVGAAEPHLQHILADHRAWLAQVAVPLIGDGVPRNVERQEALGKILTDRLRTEASAIRKLVDDRDATTERQLAFEIDEIVEFAVGLVLLVALVGLYLLIVQRNTEAALEREHTVAASLQAALGVGGQPIPGSLVGSAYVSASSEADVGGDLFDTWRLGDDRGAMVIADMSGKGLDAVVNTAFCKYSIRALLEMHSDPAAVMAKFNALFVRSVTDPSMFAVAFVGVIDAWTGTLRYVSAGHEPAFIRQGSVVRQLEVSGPAVGIISDADYLVKSVALSPGDLIVLATDGLTEARNARGDMLGAEGARELIARAPDDPQELCDALIAEVARRGGGRIADDLALLALSYQGGQLARPAEASA